MQLMNSSMKNCLIKAYDNKKAIFVARPYVLNLKKLSSLIKGSEEVKILLEEGHFGRKVKGLGRIIALSLILG